MIDLLEQDLFRPGRLSAPFGALAFGDVRGNAAEGIGEPCGSIQRYFDRDVGMQAVIVRYELFELLRRASGENLTVVRSERPPRSPQKTPPNGWPTSVTLAT